MAIIEMQVHMCCAGCQRKIKKALQNFKGVDDIEIDMELQKVTVNGYADEKKVIKKVRKTGRRAEIWQLPYNPELRNHNYNPAAQNIAYQQNQVHSFSHSTAMFYAHAPQQQPSASAGSSYNYYKHGYDTGSHHHQNMTWTSTIFGHQTGAAFSDENPNACSIIM